MFMVVIVAAAAAAPVGELPKSSAPACGVTVEKVAFEAMPFQASPLQLGPLQTLPTVPSFGWSPEAQQQAHMVSAIVDGGSRTVPSEEGKLPEAERNGQSPAVLLPNCAEPPKPKRRKRLSDYPMG